MLKFLPGILLVQLLAAGLVLIAFNWAHDPQLIVVMVLFAMIIAILAAFWFASIAREAHKNEQTSLVEQHAFDRERILMVAEKEKADMAAEKSRLQEQHAMEREQIKVQAEQEKAKITQESFRHIEKETRKAHAKANFKVGAAFTAAIGVGGLMVFSQLVTVGLVVLASSGSGLAGYLFRARQDRINQNKQIMIRQNALLERLDKD